MTEYLCNLMILLNYYYVRLAGLPAAGGAFGGVVTQGLDVFGLSSALGGKGSLDIVEKPGEPLAGCGELGALHELTMEGASFFSFFSSFSLLSILLLFLLLSLHLLLLFFFF